MNPITPAELAAYFDHTQLRAYAQRGDFEKLCAEAREYGFAMVAINPAPVSLCKDLLAGTSVHVGAAVGFPLGQSTPQVKKYETVDAIANGADEIDYVINITQLKEKTYDFIEHEMAGIVEECRGAGVISKVIFENCYLTEEEKRALCSIAREVRPHIQKRQRAAPCDTRKQGRQQRIAAVAGLVCKDNILKKGTPQHTDDGFSQKGASHKAEAKQNQGHIQHQRCDADGEPPQIVAQQGKTRQPAGCKVRALGKITDAQGVQKPRSQVIQLIRYQGLRFFFHHRTLPLLENEEPFVRESAPRFIIYPISFNF